jgi:hypothetical protein
VTEQLPPERVHVTAAVKVPDPLEPNVTDPVGVTNVPGLVSVTVEVQVVPALTGSEDGTQTTAVELARLPTARVVDPELEE